MSNTLGNLVVTIGYDKEVVIGDITIKVRKYSSNQVRLAINAPREIKIGRVPKSGDEDATYSKPQETINPQIPVIKKRRPGNTI
jgi:hypothetical protein